ncbi:hypothetical protein KUTeg_007386 [Tegillarca granosa]|uniref:Glycosyltransferase family 92 protein n=1 Tax=Tegillarca granosa TaxID=220873 RepID=A0ABQ9FGE4_TEGGR|nr:hypothetical protein KUTeg_007386 [Tegillarca granosa]
MKTGFVPSRPRKMGRYIAYRTYFILLCGMYLLLVFMFHGRLQVEIQQTQNIDEIVRHKHQNVSIIRNKKKYHLLHHPQTTTHHTSINYKTLKTVNNCFTQPDSTKFKFIDVMKETFYVYSAYYDDRYSEPSVRIMSLLSKIIKSKINIYCYFNQSNFSKRTNASIYEMCENHNRKYGGYIISCPVPNIVKHPCNVSIKFEFPERKFISKEVTLNVIKIDPGSSKYKFGVCVPPLFGNVQKESLVEFIELTRILGAEHFIFYDYHILSSDFHMVLEYYRKRNIVTVIPWKLPSVVTEPLIWYHGQLIAHNDCLYRSMSLLNVLGIMDMDEFVIPRNDTLSWKQVILPMLVGNVVGLRFPIMEMMAVPKLITAGSLTRTKQLSKIRTKIMVKPHLIFEVGIHHVSKPAKENYTIQAVDSNVAFLHHYRKCVSNYGMKCSDRITDSTALKYSKQLLTNYYNVLASYRNKIIAILTTNRSITVIIGFVKCCISINV